ncbi:MAG: hypothetical protein JJT76_14740 [Clostridiaceae bacterium]|nr:hypothetical protein [Clostridiaceae bacterium]
MSQRFGGGALISIEAGADSPRAIYKLMKGEKLKHHYYSFRENLLALRYDQALYFNK